jgi:hypothetical protein
MKTLLTMTLLSGLAAACGEALLAEPEVIITEVIDATPPPVAIPGRAVLAGPGDYTCHDGALGVRIQLERGQRRLEIVFDRDKPASHTVELAPPPAATEWFLLAERADRVWFVAEKSVVKCFDWRKDPATERRSLLVTTYGIPMDLEKLMKAGAPPEVVAPFAESL